MDSNGHCDALAVSSKPSFKRVEKVSLLEANRLRNLGKLVPYPIH